MLDRATVHHIAELAKLGLEPHELDTLGAQLSHILDYIAQLADIDVPLDAGGAAAGAPTLRLRADEAAPSLARAAVLALAPASEAGHIRVPVLLD